jgi:hypothetical protein
LQVPKLCGFYRFQKEYLNDLIDKKIIIIKYEQIDEVEEGWQGSVQDEDRKRLEKKMENLTWKMNCVFVVFGIVVLAMLVRSVVMA